MMPGTDPFPPSALLPWTPDGWQGVDFPALHDVRECPNIRRGLFYPLTVISQYEHSTTLRMLLQGLEYVISPFWEIRDFYAKVFNPHTCTAWGLDVWGRIVGADRTLRLRGLDSFFGFFGADAEPMGQASFYDPDGTSAYTLEDAQFRRLIFFKAALNISDGSLASINRIMQLFFHDRGTVMAIHTGTMRLRFWFDFDLSDAERAMLLRDDIPPVPAGVGYEIMELDPSIVFGFDGAGLQPFNHGSFVPAEGVPQDAYTV